MNESKGYDFSKIPSSFQIFGQTIQVIYRDDLYDAEKCFGETYFDKNIIYLQSPVSHKNFDLNEEMLIRIFFHEAFHIILYHLGYMDLYDNELFIEQLSGALHQLLVSGEII